uniref:Uncharacterized protein n=1 Tax=Siphoviridae sp. ctB3v5 TaxID=2826186 RepID=A0A8S5M907_9CAUD|nr:MAG TPA: hypothetical protein [Siphoviridae sp. ctB3v5]
MSGLPPAKRERISISTSQYKPYLSTKSYN